MSNPWTLLVLDDTMAEPAARLARAIRLHGHRLQAWTGHEGIAQRLVAAGAEVHRSGRAEDMVAHLVLAHPKVILFMGLRQAGPLLQHLWDTTGLVIGLSQGWLDSAEISQTCIARLDRSLVLLPAGLFQSGFGASGLFARRPGQSSWAIPLGWPADPLPVDAQPRVLLALHNPQSCAALGEAIGRVAERLPHLVWQGAFPAGTVLPAHVEPLCSAREDESWETAVAASQLLICDADLESIGLAAANGVPVLALSPGGAFQLASTAPRGEQELHLLEMAGVVVQCPQDAVPDVLERRIHMLLDEGRQQPAGGGGVVRAVALIETLLEPGCERR